MDLNALRHFYWVVREGNFSNAARALATSQPGLSRSVRRLELELGAPLLIRHKRRVELTPLGNSVFLQCQVIFEAADRIGGLKTGAGRGDVGGALRVACADSVAEYLLPGALRDLTQKYPEVYPSIQVGPASLLVTRIAAREFDFGLFFHMPSDLSPDLEVRKLRKVDFKLVVASEFYKNKDVLAKFIGSREIDSPDTKSYPALEKLRKIYPRASIRYSSNHLSLHKQLVLAGAGVAVLPFFSVRDELKRGRLRDVLPKGRLAFDLKIVQHRHRRPGPAAQALMAILALDANSIVG